MTGNQGKKFSLSAVAYIVLPFVVFFGWLDWSTRGAPASSAAKRTDVMSEITPFIKISTALSVTSTPVPTAKLLGKEDYVQEPTESYEEKVIKAQATKTAEQVKRELDLTITRTNTLLPTRTATVKVIYPTNTQINYVPTVKVITVQVTKIVEVTSRPTSTKTQTKTPTVTPTPELIILKTFTSTIPATRITPENLKNRVYLSLIVK